jgi:hypothetical protein
MKLNTDIQKDGQVLVYDAVLPHNVCVNFIERFEAEPQNQVDTRTQSVRQFKELNISEFWMDEHKIMERVLEQGWKSYMTVSRIEFGIQWPKQFGYEAFRMKRYLPNGVDQFGHHVDVGSYGSARRFLAFLWYLNTVTDGGETGFGKDVDNPDLIVPAVEGRLLMFPPLWTHPHWGAKPKSSNKYIVSGYLHYI